MKRLIQCLLICAMLASSANAEQRLIVRVLGGQTTINSICGLLGCNVIRGLDDPAGQVFLIGIADTVNQLLFIQTLLLNLQVLDVEVDLLVNVRQNQPPIPAALYDSTLVSYFGVNVRSGYVSQPALQIIRLAEARSTFGFSGVGTIAVIDTGVDPTHPVLQPVLLPGYDFTHNVGSGSEAGDVTQSTAAVVDGVPPTYVNPYTAAIVDQSTAAVVDDPGHAAFGHGTMVAGLIHVVTPQARVLPLKAFQANGSGYTSDILRAIYYAGRNGAGVINMSFSMSQASSELRQALNYATSSGIVCVASAGNDGAATMVYPAGFSNVIGVASTTNDDVRSTFSNYGASLVWLTAPGEGVITTYPFGSYAAFWGTSASTPLVSGTVNLLLQSRPGLTPSQAADAIGHARLLSADLGHGRLDIVQAIQATR
jgi:hypothetical protein